MLDVELIQENLNEYLNNLDQRTSFHMRIDELIDEKITKENFFQLIEYLFSEFEQWKIDEHTCLQLIFQVPNNKIFSKVTFHDFKKDKKAECNIFDNEELPKFFLRLLDYEKVFHPYNFDWIKKWKVIGWILEKNNVLTYYGLVFPKNNKLKFLRKYAYGVNIDYALKKWRIKL